MKGSGQKKKLADPVCQRVFDLRRCDSNARPPGYEPGELPLLHAAPCGGRSAAPQFFGPVERPFIFIIPNTSSSGTPIGKLILPIWEAVAKYIDCSLVPRDAEHDPPQPRSRLDASATARMDAACLGGLRFLCLAAPSLPQSPCRHAVQVVRRLHRHFRQPRPYAVALGAGSMVRQPARPRADRPRASVHHRPLAHRHHAAARNAYSRSATYVSQYLSMFGAESFSTDRNVVQALVSLSDAVSAADG